MDDILGSLDFILMIAINQNAIITAKWPDDPYRRDDRNVPFRQPISLLDAPHQPSVDRNP
jgi:hypothetical protein